MRELKELNQNFREKIMKDKEVIAVFVFGSYTRNEHYRDIDLCFILDKKYPNLNMSKKAVKYASLLPSKFDVKIFQQLPVYIRIRVLKEGKIVLCKNEDLLYEVALSTVKEFEFYKKIYHNYLMQFKK